MRCFKLPAAIILEVRGKDATRYLHNRLTNNIRALQVGDTCLAAALSPQGKAQGFFSVSRIDDAGYLLLCDGGDPATVLAGLLKYKVADRVEVSDHSKDWEVCHIYDREQRAGKVDTSDEVFLVSRQRSRQSGVDVIGPRASVQTYLEAADAGDFIDEDHAKILRFSAKIPAFPDEINEQLLFAEAGLTDAVSFSKGCYVGQEVLERIDAIGRLPRRLCVVRVSGDAAQVGEKVFAPDSEGEGAIGKVISRVYDRESQKTLCFISIRNDDEDLTSVRLNGQLLEL